MKTVCVIGGGASGLVSAYFAQKNGNKVILIEKNEKLGKKIYITGKGRCNITNAVEPDDFLESVVNGKKFLTGALYSFTPRDMIELLESYSLPVKIERGNRAFPVSDKASDVTKTLEKACKSVGVEIHLNEKVEKLLVEKPDGETTPRITGVKTDQTTYSVDYCIVATGGISYPTTGSTGDGHAFAKDCGIEVTPLYPALCGINLKGEDFKPLQGLSLLNVRLTCYEGKKPIFSDFGEMLFTHFGISGPIVLSLSSNITRKKVSNLIFKIDLKPALDERTLDNRILRDFEEFKNKQIVHALVKLLPQSMILPLLTQAKINPQTSVNSITKEERSALIKTLKAFTLYPSSLRDFSEAVVTSGGVDLKEINPKTMEAKKVQGLKFCGEVLDIDALTGGFNLQLAFSTGFIAGNSIKD